MLCCLLQSKVQREKPHWKKAAAKLTSPCGGHRGCGHSRWVPCAFPVSPTLGKRARHARAMPAARRGGSKATASPEGAGSALLVALLLGALRLELVVVGEQQAERAGLDAHCVCAQGVRTST
jgi:hypothetical protein